MYDAESSQSLTQAHVAELVKRGEEIQVVDSESGGDITVEVLGKIVLAQATRGPHKNESKELFASIIKLGGKKTMSILRNTVLASIGVIEVTKAKAEKIIDDLIKKGDLNKSDRKKAIMELLEKAEKSTEKVRARVSREADRAGKEITRLTKEVKGYKIVSKTDMKKLEDKVDKLTKALEELQKKLDEK